MFLVFKSVSAVYDMKAVSAFAPVGQVNRPPVSRDTRGQKGPRVRSSKTPNPEIKVIRDKIKDLNKQISMKSVLTDKPLSEDDELIVNRNQLFRDLKGLQSYNPQVEQKASIEG